MTVVAVVVAVAVSKCSRACSMSFALMSFDEFSLCVFVIVVVVSCNVYVVQTYVRLCYVCDTSPAAPVQSRYICCTVCAHGKANLKNWFYACAADAIRTRCPAAVSAVCAGSWLCVFAMTL